MVPHMLFQYDNGTDWFRTINDCWHHYSTEHHPQNTMLSTNGKFQRFQALILTPSDDVVALKTLTLFAMLETLMRSSATWKRVSRELFYWRLFLKNENFITNSQIEVFTLVSAVEGKNFALKIFAWWPLWMDCIG
jgi:hypothetical protein